MKKEGMKFGIAWFREDQWPLLRSTASDSEVIEDTYQEWLDHAYEFIKKLKKEGYQPVKIDFDVNEFNDWCQRNMKVPNGDSRSEYTAHLLRVRDENSSN